MKTIFANVGSNRITWKPASAGATHTGKLVIDEGNKVHEYKVTEFPADRDFNGRGFACQRADYLHGGHYDILISNIDAEADSCDCRGFVAHGHCKHCDSLREVIQRGGIGDEPEPYDCWTEDEIEEQAGDPAWHEELDRRAEVFAAQFSY